MALSDVDDDLEYGRANIEAELVERVAPVDTSSQLYIGAVDYVTRQ